MKPLPVSLARDLARLKMRQDRSVYRKYKEIFGSEPKFIALPIVRDLVAGKLQADYYGALPKAAEEALMEILNEPEEDRKQLLPGTRLVRVWQGVRHEVIVRPNRRFEYNGTLFNSLSAVAERITGTHRSGRIFFGVA